MNITKTQVREARDRLMESKYGDPYLSERAATYAEVQALSEEIDDLKKIVLYLAHQAVNR